MPRAKVVCTLGPASEDRETVADLVRAGMSVARLNASHGTTEGRAALIERVRDVSERLGEPVATMLDVPGPEIRTAPLEAPVELPTGAEYRLEPGETVDGDSVGLSGSIAAAAPGDRVLLDDGRIETTVERVAGDTVVVRVDSGGELGGRKGVNVPGVDLGLEFVTEADRAELRLAAEADVAYVATSFVGSADDVYAVDAVLESLGADIPVVAKIERADAVENLQGILEAADGVMVARGDLGVECPLEQVPLIQKRVIREARRAGIPVITATEMLDSMVHSRRPTRAEASDVANAVLDGTDAVMLSGETAVGDHPVRVVETMARIVDDVEASEDYAESREQRVPPAGDSRTDAIARSARYLARDVDASAVVTVTESGYTAGKVAKYRPAVPVVAVTPDERVRQRLALPWGITPRHLPFPEGGATELIEGAATAAIDAGVAESGDTVVVLAGMMTDLEGANTTNTLKVHLAAEVLASGRGVRTGRAAGPVVHSADGDLTGIPDGAVLVLPEAFDGELGGDLSAVGAVVAADRGMTSYAAMVARELGVPMVGGVDVDATDGTVVTVDGDRGVVYESEVAER
ncbi:pyruvate kinase [Haloglomus irregulare]|jgi:pyruvate kinase|uniref:Pyruvate kinase n=2 Tax=Halobacteriales TaxID=2235 RepID=A0A554MUG9_9EURY|nr:pyruvate kinase [Haloglomus irregulare]ABT17395.1 pyruvate kinase [uncultured haloarchaeon FLAS10H9]TSD08778.1 pyruvate kinase [Haloglomus irregulare]